MSNKSAADKTDPPTVRLIHPSYSPSREELAEDLCVDATLQELGRAVTRTVTVEYYKPKRARR